jgi:GNAT superfamily N-acetyltransferase
VGITTNFFCCITAKLQQNAGVKAVIMIEIINYEDRYHNDFRQLNLEWLEKYGLAEKHDYEVLDNPMAIITGGGSIFLARFDNSIAGTAALAKMYNQTYELIKMAVTPGMRGSGIGTMLLEHCLAKARLLKAEKIILYSNSKLQAAINMYLKHGFEHIAVTDSPFVTADVKMQLSL